MDIELLAEGFYDYSNYIRGYSKTTIRRYKWAIRFFCKVTKIKDIEDVTDKNTREFFMYGRITRDWSPGTFISYYNSLLIFFRWCVEKGHMTKNFIKEIETPKLNKSLPKKISTNDAYKILDTAYNYPYDYHFLRYRNHAIFSMFLYAGLRKSELLNIKLSEVDIENLTLFITKGKGSKDRMIPMSQTLAQSLKKYLQERKRLKNLP
jgi:site-specific recombinase XerD